LQLRVASQSQRVARSSTPPLHTYEFRWILDTISGKRSGPDRICSDLQTAKLYAPQHYYKVADENRLWSFAEEVGNACDMGFKLET
jgi:hypothetical protein